MTFPTEYVRWRTPYRIVSKRFEKFTYTKSKILNPGVKRIFLEPNVKFVWSNQKERQSRTRHQKNCDLAHQRFKNSPFFNMRDQHIRKENRDVAISMALSKLLRHQADNAGLKLDDEAYAQLNQVLEWPRLKYLNVTVADIQRIVAQDSKQRFSLKLNPFFATPPDPNSTEPQNWVIRANQGHSINIDTSKLLHPVTLEAGNAPDIAVHGTFYSFYPSIIESGGLRRMTRTHIHLTTGSLESYENPKNFKGLRKDMELLIYVDVKSSLASGILWWLSSNGVLLTTGNSDGVLPVKYFKKVISLVDNDTVGVLWEDGVEIKQLPESLRNRERPKGKIIENSNRKFKYRKN